MAWNNKDTGLQRLADQAKEEAMYLTQLSLASADKFDAAVHFGASHLHGGFVYSADEIKVRPAPCRPPRRGPSPL